VTVPTSSVGREIAIQLAELGAEIILACRDVQKEMKLQKKLRIAKVRGNLL
jgi:short-subunit dehydrogenase